MKSLRYEQHREKLNFAQSLPKELKIKIATTAEEYMEGYKIIYDCYLEKGYATQNSHSVRATPYHLLPSTTMILAFWNDEVIGTVSLVRDNPLGLPLEAIFDLAAFRKEQKTICEVSSLAIKKEFRGQGGEVFYPLIRYMWNYAHDFFGVDYFVIAVNPSMQELYESIFYFEPLIKNNTVETYDFANNNPAVGQYIDLKNSYRLFDEKYGDAPFSKNLSLYLQQKSIPNYQYPTRKYFTHRDSPASPEWVDLFGKYVPQLENREIRNSISNAFGYINESEMNDSNDHNHNRNRIPVTFHVLNFPLTRAVDISKEGLKIISQHDFSMTTPTLLRLQISKDASITILAQPVWKKDPGVYGFQIIDESLKWDELIQEAYRRPHSKLDKVG